MSDVEIKSSVKVAGGRLMRFSHQSAETGTPMVFAVFLPVDGEESNHIYPSIMYLSGLTCTDENVCQKGGAFQKLAELKVLIDSCLALKKMLFIINFDYITLLDCIDCPRYFT